MVECNSNQAQLSVFLPETDMVPAKVENVVVDRPRVHYCDVGVRHYDVLHSLPLLSRPEDM